MALRLTSGPHPAPSNNDRDPQDDASEGLLCTIRAPGQLLPRRDPQPLEPEPGSACPCHVLISSPWPLGSCIQVMWFLLGAGAPQQSWGGSGHCRGPAGLRWDPGFCPHSCVPSAAGQAAERANHLDVTSAPPCVCGRQTQPVPGDPDTAPGWEPAGPARPCLPRAASCAINDKAAAEVCLGDGSCVRPGSLCVCVCVCVVCVFVCV